MEQWREQTGLVNSDQLFSPDHPYMYISLHEFPSSTDLILILSFMGPTWDPSGADRTQVGPMLAPWTLLSGKRSRLLGVTDVEHPGDCWGGVGGFLCF